MSIHRSHILIAALLMITIAVDIMGLGLVFPVLPDLFFSKAHALVPADMSTSWRNFLYGVTMFVWPIGLFLGAPYFGDLSDKLSRKTVLLTCLFGTMAAYFLSAVAIHAHLLTLFLITRFFVGFFGGSITIAQAIMIDISTPETKTHYISMISLSASVGIIFGPLITSISTMESLSGFFSITAPFAVASIMSLITGTGIFVFLKKTPPTNPQAALNLLKGVTTLYSTFIDHRTRLLIISFFLLSFGWGLYVEGAPLLLHKALGYESSSIALFFMVFGIADVLMILLLQPIILQRFSLRAICFYAGIIVGIAIALNVITNFPLLLWVAAFFAAGIELLLYNTFLTVFSNAVTEKEQGKVLGGVSAAFAFSWILVSPLLGFLANYHMGLIMLLGGAAFVASAMCFWPKHE